MATLGACQWYVYNVAASTSYAYTYNVCSTSVCHMMDHQARPLKPIRTTPRNSGTKSQTTVNQRFELGARIAAWFDDNPSAPAHKWQIICRGVVNLKYTDAVVARLRRAHQLWQQKSGTGLCTEYASGINRRGQLRATTSRVYNSFTATLSFELLQWFMDDIVSIKCRSDSCLVMSHARMLHGEMLKLGVDPSRLPTIDRKAHV